jgi:superfamily II DNA or RNA helicase
VDGGAINGIQKSIVVVVRVAPNGEFSLRVPLSVMGGKNNFQIYAINRTNGTVSKPSRATIIQSGAMMSPEEEFLAYLRDHPELLRRALRGKERRLWFTRTIEQGLLPYFTENEKKGFDYLQKKINLEEIRAIKKVLKDIQKKFILISKIKTRMVKGRKLYFFQKYADFETKEARKKGFRGILIAMDPGLGKTLVALVELASKTALIISPNPVVSTWCQLAGQFFLRRPLLALQGEHANRESQLADTQGHTAVVTNIEFARNGNADILARFVKKKKAEVVVDEAQLLRNSESKQTKGVISISQSAAFTTFLSATPFNRPEQIRVLLYLLTGSKKFSTKERFSKAFPLDTPDSVRSLIGILRKHMIRIKKNVFKEYDDKDPDGIPLHEQSDRLPKKISMKPDTSEYELTQEQFNAILELYRNPLHWNEAYPAFQELVKRDVDEGENVEETETSMGYLAFLNILKHVQNSPRYLGRSDEESPKYKKMDEIVKKELDSSIVDKTIIFCRYRSEVEYYMKQYGEMYGARAYYGGLKQNKNGFQVDDDGREIIYKFRDGNYVLENGKPIRWDSSDGGKPILALDYERLVFQNDPNCRMLIATYNSGSVGVTLTAATSVIFDDVPKSFIEEFQAGSNGFGVRHG